MSMRFHHRLFVVMRSLFRRRTVEDELDDELRFHLEQMEALDATHTRRDFGGLDQVKEACRDVRPLRPLEQALQDLRFGARLLARNPVFTLVTSLSLALGIGANSAVFSLINGLLFRPLPVPQAEELHVAKVAPESDAQSGFAYPAFEAARALIGARAELAAASSIQPMQVSAPAGSGAGQDRHEAKAGGSGTYASEWGRVQLVSGEYFRLLRRGAQIGRLLEPEDNRTLGQPAVAVISDSYWTRRFDRALTVVGTELIVNGAPVTIVGVTAPGFFGTTVGSSYADLWLPVMMQAHVRYAGRMTATDGDANQPWPPQPGVLWLDIILRIPSGSVAAVTEALNLAAPRDVVSQPPSPSGAGSSARAQAPRITLTPAAEGLSEIRAAATAPLAVLLTMVVVLLIVTCANVASLLLARASNRHREMAIRLSIGAGRGRLVRQLLTESVLLAALGGGLGLLLAYWGIRVGQRSALANGIDISIDWRVTTLTLVISLAAGLVFGLLPALRGTDRSLTNPLKSHTRGALGSSGHFAPGKLLIAGQIAFSILLLVLAALFARSLRELIRVDVGFDRDRLIVARVDARAGGFARSDAPALYRRVLERLTAIPGVTAASMSTNPPFSGSRVRSGFEIEGYARRADEQLSAHEEHVTVDYFKTVGLRVVHGRSFGPDDREGRRRVTIINQTMAKRYFPNQHPVGRHWSADPDFQTHGYEIVGVVQDAHHDGLRSAAPNVIYLPASPLDEDFLNGIEVRTAGRPDALVDTVRTSLREAEPRLPVTFINTLDERIRTTTNPDRLLTWLTSAFGGLALLLACLGLYGTITYAVTRRTAELGLRMALGGSPASVRWLVMREALSLLGVGLCVGLPLAFLGARAIRHLLHGITPVDIQAYGIAVTPLVILTVLAAYVPARRASRVDPLSALRAE